MKHQLIETARCPFPWCSCKEAIWHHRGQLLPRPCPICGELLTAVLECGTKTIEPAAKGTNDD